MVVVVFALAGLAIARIWELHQKEILHRQLTDRIEMAKDMVRAGQVEAALPIFSRSIIETCKTDLADKVEPLSLTVQRLEQYGVSSNAPNRPAQLSLIGLISDRNLPTHEARWPGGPGGLPHPRRSTVGVQPRSFAPTAGKDGTRPGAAEILMMLALQRAIDLSDRVSSLRILDWLRQAAKLDEPSSALRLLQGECYRRLGDEVEANRAADQARRLTSLGPGLLPDRCRGRAAGPRTQDGGGMLPTSGTNRSWPLRGPVLACSLHTRHKTSGKRRRPRLPLASHSAPGKSGLYYYRGVARLHLEQYLAALDYDFDRFTRLHPTHKLGHYWKGRIHFLAGQWEQADREFSAAWQSIAGFSLRILAAHSRGPGWAGTRRLRKTPRRPIRLRIDAQTVWQSAQAYAQAVRAVPRDSDLADRYWGAVRWS